MPGSGSAGRAAAACPSPLAPFEKLSLEGFQSGLSWRTILAKRENFRAAFAGFEIPQVARYGERDVERLLQDACIVRHRGNIEAVINNAQCAETMLERGGITGRLRLALRTQPGRAARTADRHDVAHLDRPVQGPAQARLEVRRPDNRLRLHAGRGTDQRPHERLRDPPQAEAERLAFTRPGLNPALDPTFEGDP